MVVQVESTKNTSAPTAPNLQRVESSSVSIANPSTVTTNFLPFNFTIFCLPFLSYDIGL